LPEGLQETSSLESLPVGLNGIAAIGGSQGSFRLGLAAVEFAYGISANRPRLIFAVAAFLPLPLARSYVELTRLPSMRTCEPFLIAVRTYSASRGRKTHSSSAFFHERLLLPRRAATLWEGPALFGRNRESRSREAAGRRN